MTLKQLMEQLHTVGKALSDEAMRALQPSAAAGGAGASLEFLGAPRNALMLRWKPEAKAAIRRAFEIVVGELRDELARGCAGRWCACPPPLS